MVNVPSWAVPLINRMSVDTGLPFAIIACQANEESGFNANAVSPAGAEGWLQFLPGTFASYASGSPFNVNDAATAYIGFMNVLLRWSGGDVQKALAAYNAGQGNWQAGLGYADTIIGCAGGGQSSVHISPHQEMVKVSLGEPGNIAADDWSYWIGEAAQSFQDLSNVAAVYHTAIDRI